MPPLRYTHRQFGITSFNYKIKMTTLQKKLGCFINVKIMFLNNLNYSPSECFLSPNTGYTGYVLVQTYFPI